MASTPSFQFYPNDWLSSTNITLMTPAEEGGYIRLLCHAWNDADCCLPADDESLMALSRLTDSVAMAKVRDCFIAHPDKPGRLTHERLLRERIKQAEWRNKSSKGGSAKWYKDAIKEAQNKDDNSRSKRLVEARKKGRHTKESWENMKVFFDFTCVKCGEKEPDIKIVKDHITPIYQGGSDGINNIQPLCDYCNASKGPEDKDYRRIYNNLHNKKKISTGMPTKRLPKAYTPSSSLSLSSTPSFTTPLGEKNPSGEPDISDTIGLIIGHLNTVLKTQYKVTTQKTRDLIQARLNQGHTIEGFKIVIDKKFLEWKDDIKMAKFLRPETLFGNKFEGYLNQKAPSKIKGTEKTSGNWDLLEQRKREGKYEQSR